MQAGKPSPAAVLDFARALSCGAASDRGRQRIARAKEIIGSKFVASKLGLPVLDDSVRCPAVSAWLASGKWARASAREAVPLPLTVVVRLELALAASGDDFWLLGSMLLMIWGGLRWSDAQRLVPRSRVLAPLVLAYQDAGVWYAFRRFMPWCYREDVGSAVWRAATGPSGAGAKKRFPGGPLWPAYGLHINASANETLLVPPCRPHPYRSWAFYTTQLQSNIIKLGPATWPAAAVARGARSSSPTK